MHRSKKRHYSVFNSKDKSLIKRARINSTNMSDSGLSSMSNSSKFTLSSDLSEILKDKQRNKWPSLTLLTKPNEICLNGRNKNRFPDPVQDRSLLLACFDSSKKMLKLRHSVNKDSLTVNSKLFRQRVAADDTDSEYFISLDRVHVEDTDTVVPFDEICENLMISDVREHSVAAECLPAGVSGYWVRVFGPQRHYKLTVSLWKHLNKKSNRRQKKDKMKIGVLCIDVLNSGVTKKVKSRKRSKKTIPHSKNLINHRDLKGTDYIPSFCSREQYVQISTSLHECTVNGQHELFDEMVNKFGPPDDDTRENIEMKLFLNCEKSIHLAVQGSFTEAKELLQKIVEGVVPKSGNKAFLLNRAYLRLASVHVMEGNYGTAEECLNVLQIDKKNGTPHEDVSTFYYLQGIIFCSFGKRLPALSRELYKESEAAFLRALDSFDHAAPALFNHLNTTLIDLAKLYLYKEKEEKDGETSKAESSSHSLALSTLERVESVEIDKLSKRVCYMYEIVKAEMQLYDGEYSAAKIALSALSNEVKRLKFKDLSLLIDSLQSDWCDKEYNDFMNSIEGSKDNNTSCSTESAYSGDQSTTQSI